MGAASAEPEFTHDPPAPEAIVQLDVRTPFKSTFEEDANSILKRLEIQELRQMDIDEDIKIK